MKITIVPSDKIIVIDNNAVQFDFVVDSKIPTIHAIQWNGTSGHIEHIDENGKMIAVENINSIAFIQPLIDRALAEIEKIKKQKAEAAKYMVAANTVNSGTTIIG